MKQQGVTKGAGLGYSISPSSSAAAERIVDGLATVGLPGAYINTSIPFGGENVGSVILDMKRQGVDGAYLAMDNNTNFAVANAAIQNGLTFKALVMATGYDETLLDNPTALATAEKGNVFIASNFVPYEAATPGVNRMQAIFQKYLGIPTTQHPIFGYWIGYSRRAAARSTVSWRQGATRPGRASSTRCGRSATGHADGLFCSGVSFTMATYGQVNTREGCSYIIKVARTASSWSWGR